MDRARLISWIVNGSNGWVAMSDSWFRVACLGVVIEGPWKGNGEEREKGGLEGRWREKWVNRRRRKAPAARKKNRLREG